MHANVLPEIIAFSDLLVSAVFARPFYLPSADWQTYSMGRSLLRPSFMSTGILYRIICC